MQVLKSDDNINSRQKITYSLKFYSSSWTHLTPIDPRLLIIFRICLFFRSAEKWPDPVRDL